MSMDRREFLKAAAGAQTGFLLAGGRTPAAESSSLPARGALRQVAAAPEVVVIGAGAFGGWTAYHLREMGASVTLVDAYGPGNSRATSGDETRGIRTAYGAREPWTRWASEAIVRWKRWDEEWSQRLGLQLFFQTGDLILRPDWDAFLTDTRRVWDQLGVRYEVLTLDEVAHRYPMMNLDGFGAAVIELDAGVGRARRACEAVAQVFGGMGGNVVIGRAELGQRAGGRLEDVVLSPGGRLTAQAFVFACGPWLPKLLPDVMNGRVRTPLGHVYYFGTPPGDNRYTYPNMPSYNVPGVTGWPALPPDNRGFRVRTGGRTETDPDATERWIERSFHEQPRQFLAQRFPELKDAPLLETRACHYDLTPDRNFIVEQHPELENVWIAGGGSAEGFKFGPVIGEYVAQRVLGENTDIDLITHGTSDLPSSQ
ncbi:MAG: FAD-dependent oxidoreductase [Gemmatimonadetes bacterium]|nr:FAD-dependent oxidoreductase [Gemmatimonadota bacterium]